MAVVLVLASIDFLEMGDPADLSMAVERLAAFLAIAPLTNIIAEIEGELEGLGGTGAAALARQRGVDATLLAAAVTVRRDLGRLSDLIHASAILLLIPLILSDGELVSRRPSLAAGNDPSRPYDLETNLRVAEFKLSAWNGGDAMRKRHVFKDLVHLAADSSGRQPELFVVGEAPGKFLRASRSPASWALDQFPTTRSLFTERFHSLDVSIAEFVAGQGARVRITDISELLPAAGLRNGLDADVGRNASTRAAE